MPPTSLYIHVPFCARRCFYCDFAVEAQRQPPVDRWIDLICREARLVANEQAWPGPIGLETLYIGGGTPSLLGLGAMQKLRDGLSSVFELQEGAEWTCEANPESFGADLATDWREAGVNRISLGAQSFHAPALRWMGRLHGPDGIASAVNAARNAGFDNISLDLIFGLPARLERDWGDDLSRALELDPEHISLYGLTAEAGAPLGRRVREGKEVLADDDRYAEEFLLAHASLSAAGYQHYEVSSFGREGRRSRHNSAYWQDVDYAALGPGAHAYLRSERRWNVRSWSDYSVAVEQGSLPLADSELIGDEERGMERSWLRLRTLRGIHTSELDTDQLRLARNWAERGLASVAENRLVLNANGWLLLDELTVELGATALAGTNRGQDELTLAAK